MGHLADQEEQEDQQGTAVVEEAHCDKEQAAVMRREGEEEVQPW